MYIKKNHLSGDERAWVSYHDASTVEKTVGDGGKFGLISNMPARFKNFAIITATNIEVFYFMFFFFFFFLFFGFIYFFYFQFRMYFPFCPTSEGVAARISALLGIESGEVLFFFLFFFFPSPSLTSPPPPKRSTTSRLNVANSAPPVKHQLEASSLSPSTSPPPPSLRQLWPPVWNIFSPQGERGLLLIPQLGSLLLPEGPLLLEKLLQLKVRPPLLRLREGEEEGGG